MKRFFEKLGESLNLFVLHYFPDSFLIAVLLGTVVYILGLLLTPSGPLDMVKHAGDGFWILLNLSMQASFGLIGGATLAMSPPIRKLAHLICRWPNSARQAIALNSVVALLLWYINWGFGLVLSAVFAISMAREMEDKGIKVHYPLLGASAYGGILAFEVGWSGIIALFIASPGHFLESKVGIIPVTETLLSAYNLVTFALILVTVPLLFSLMHPTGNRTRTIELFSPTMAAKRRDEEKEENSLTFGAKLDKSPLFLLLPIGLLLYSALYFADKGLRGINFNSLNILLLGLGLFFFLSLRKYLAAFYRNVPAAAGIILQFPIYAAIMGMMMKSGLVKVIANFFASISNEYTYPFMTMVSAGVVNIFVPAGGAQWVVQGPVMMEAAKTIGVDYAFTAMAVGWGDVWTNLIQPFWALPVMGLMGLKIHDVIGYTGSLLIFVGIIISATVLLFAPMYV